MRTASPRLVLSMLLVAGVAPAQLAVQSVSPPRNAVGADRAAAISVAFATPVDPATVTPASLRVFGRWSGVTPGAIAFGPGDLSVSFTTARPFFPGESVTVSLSAAVRGAGGEVLAGGHTWTFWVEAARSTGNLVRWHTIPVRRPGEGRIQTYGVYAGDLDQDGAPDLSMPNEESNDVRVFNNDGCGAFTMTSVHPVANNSTPSTNEGQDFDGDGRTDLAVGSIDAGTMSVFLGDGAGGYLPAVTYPSGLGTRGLAVLDVEGDGDVDVVTANRVSSNLALHRNRGDGTFEPAAFFDGGGNGETSVTAADADGDGIGDLLVANYTSHTLTVLLGRGDGTFALSATRAVPNNPWMIAAGDMDGDGDVDAVACSRGSAQVSVLLGDGNGGLATAASYPVGAFPLAVDLGDLSGDGALDCVVSSLSSGDFTVYLNQGAGVLGSRRTLPSVQAGSCAVLCDHDRDGDLDVLGIDEVADLLLVFGQVGPLVPEGVAAPHCGATLRVDNFAIRAGYGAEPPHATPSGSSFFAGVTGAPAQPFALLVGLPLASGIALPFGLLNLSAPIGSLPPGVTDGFGEAQLAITTPLGVPAGVVVALQGAVLDPSSAAGVRLSNPEQIGF